MYLYGEAMDPLASNLDLSVANTVCLSGAELNVVAGNSVSLVFETRTVDARLRTNHWFSDVSASIKATFASESVSYSVARGDVKGRYVITLTPTLAGKNQITLTINGIKFTGSTPLLNVQPASISSFELCNEKSELQTLIADQSVDSDFQVYFIAKDTFKNRYILNSTSIQNAIFLFNG